MFLYTLDWVPLTQVSLISEKIELFYLKSPNYEIWYQSPMDQPDQLSLRQKSSKTIYFYFHFF